eukprot:Amastigsp_a846204_48.p2 type:complete len:195 gc:universal Amastigsp_a846204_48:911-327(-)
MITTPLQRRRISCVVGEPLGALEQDRLVVTHPRAEEDRDKQLWVRHAKADLLLNATRVHHTTADELVRKVRLQHSNAVVLDCPVRPCPHLEFRKPTVGFGPLDRVVKDLPGEHDAATKLGEPNPGNARKVMHDGLGLGNAPRHRVRNKAHRVAAHRRRKRVHEREHIQRQNLDPTQHKLGRYPLPKSRHPCLRE